MHRAPRPLGLAAFVLAATALGAENRAAEPDAAASYSLGLSFATQWRDAGLGEGLDEQALMRGIHDGLAAKPVTAEDRTRASNYLHAAYESLGARNKAAAAEFLARNGKEPGMQTTASGLQYLVLAPGDPVATPPGANDHVTVQYRGRLLDGTEFDSSFARGKPAVIRPSTVIAGWREALALMGRGAKWRVFIPPELAYGVSPPPSIPPNSLLVFEIEVMGIEPAGPARTAAH